MWETLTYGWVRGFVSDGTIDYWNRVYGYAVALVSDEYPSFGL
jgi:hypothetical protein